MNNSSDVTLKEKLERFKLLTSTGLDLSLVWAPDAENTLSGKVKGRTIYCASANAC